MAKIGYIFIRYIGIFTLLLLLLYCRQEDISGPGPVITGVSPLEAAPGESINISGKGFNAKKTSVYFQEVPGLVKAITAESIVVEVPNGATSGAIKVVSKGQSVVFPYLFTVSAEPPLTRHTITIHQNQRVASFLLSSREFAELEQYGENDRVYTELIEDVYRRFEDDFDFIFAIKNNMNFWGKKPGAYAKILANDVLGTGRGLFNYSDQYGSSGKLKGIMAFSRPDFFENYTIFHEVMHFWGNYAFNTENYNFVKMIAVPDAYHWGFSGCGGVLNGFDQSTLRFNEDDHPNKYSFINVNNVGFSNFEMYLMGLIGPHEIEPFDVLTGVISAEVKNGRVHVEAEERATWDRTKIENTLGVRNPDYTISQKEFKVLTLVFTKLPLSDKEFKEIDDRLEKLAQKFEVGAPNLNFWEATQGKATLIVGDLFQSLKH